MNKVGIITQARLSSTRLPRKIFKEINNKKLFEYHMEGLNQSGFPVYVATTTESIDEEVESYCIEKNINVFRGSQNDVLSRYHFAAQKFKLDTIIRVTSDCPFINGSLIKSGYEKYLSYNSKHVYLSNGMERTYPRGFDFEIFSADLLAKAHNSAVETSDREHVTPFIIYSISEVIKDFFMDTEDLSSIRLTVDEIDDFNLAELLIKKYDFDKMNYEEQKIFIKKNIQIFKMNMHVNQKKN